MGLERKVTVPLDTVPSWSLVAKFFAAKNFPLKVMMIDGALSFPDEQPPDSWRDLRLGTPLGMVTLRKENDAFRVITWGNASGPLLQAWNALTLGLAKIFRGVIHDGEGTVSALEFANKAELPEGFVF
jgi:hypothetical protein